MHDQDPFDHGNIYSQEKAHKNVGLFIPRLAGIVAWLAFEPSTIAVEFHLKVQTFQLVPVLGDDIQHETRRSHHSIGHHRPQRLNYFFAASLAGAALASLLASDFLASSFLAGAAAAGFASCFLAGAGACATADNANADATIAINAFILISFRLKHSCILCYIFNALPWICVDFFDINFYYLITKLFACCAV